MMQAIDSDTVQKVSDWLKRGKEVWLCTVIKTYGAASRPVGALFAFNGEEKSGYLSNDFVEDTFVEKLKSNVFADLPELYTYEKYKPAGMENKGIICCGTVELLIEKIIHSEETIQNFEQWLGYIKARVSYERKVNVINGQSTLKKLEGKSTEAIIISKEHVQLYYGQDWRMIIVGFSQVSMYLAKLAKMAEYKVYFCENRKEFASAWDSIEEKGGVNISCEAPARFIEKFADNQTAVLALAHCPLVDDPALIAALHSEAFYIGALGSKKNAQKRVERLREIENLVKHDLKRVQGPVGLSIGSKTPMEIAVSIMAEVISYKNKARSRV